MIVGIFKKFVIANLLAMFALNAANALQITSSIWLWIVLYAYSFMLYLDFAGYTDVAIGMGLLVGIRLPENFDRPYIRSNLQHFWNSWHITLAQWFRSYVFNPMTRALRKGQVIKSTGLIILIGQMTTMVLIGLWHDITWNFAIWGAWHGVGLFAHNRWTNYLRTHPNFVLSGLEERKLLRFANVFLTFNYVALGWVWFALPTPELSLQVFGRLFGVSG